MGVDHAVSAIERERKTGQQEVVFLIPNSRYHRPAVVLNAAIYGIHSGTCLHVALIGRGDDTEQQIVSPRLGNNTSLELNTKRAVAIVETAHPIFAQLLIGGKVDDRCIYFVIIVGIVGKGIGTQGETTL